MGRWLTFLKERIPYYSYSFLVSGIALSGIFVAKKHFSLEHFAISFGGLFLFFSILCVINDIKDIARDRIAHPQRPLARGLLTLQEAREGLKGFFALMLAYAIIVRFVVHAEAFRSYLVMIGYLWLMSHQFFLGLWIIERPLLYAVSNQLMIFPIAAFTLSIAEPSLAISMTTLWYGMFLFGAFLAYEVGRNWDPRAHPVLNTYRQVYGTIPSAGFIALAMVLAAIGAYSLKIHHLTWTIQALTAIIPFMIGFKAPRAYFSVKFAVSLTLVYHTWVIAIDNIFR